MDFTENVINFVSILALLCGPLIEDLFPIGIQSHGLCSPRLRTSAVTVQQWLS